MTISTIVVGVDGDPASHSALRFAIDEATMRGARVMVVACWSSEARYLPHRPDGHEHDTFRRAQLVAQEAVSSVAANDVERSIIVTESGEGVPGPMLVHSSRDAELLIIGSTTRGALARHTGKTVVDHCLRFSDVPVIVVPYAPPGLEDLDLDLELSSSSADRAGDIPVRYDPFALGDSELADADR